MSFISLSKINKVIKTTFWCQHVQHCDSFNVIKMTDLGEAKGHCKLHHGEDVFLWNCQNFDQISSFLHHISYDFLDINRILKDDRMSVFDRFWSFTECFNTYHVSRLKYVSQVILGQCFILRISKIKNFFRRRTIVVKIALWLSNIIK